MAFRLKLDEPIEKDFRRIGVEQIERARQQLAANLDPAAEVHEARKCMKRIRALLRLGRIGLGDTVFRAENAYFRSIGASLSPARDDHVLLQTIVKLSAEESGSATSALAHLKKAVLAHRSAGQAETNSARADADAALDRALRRFRRLRIEPECFATLEQGLVRNYRKALKTRDLAYTAGADEAFHDWRKCVQIHWRHMQLLSRAWPALFDAHVEAARELSQILGDDHDLALLKAKLAALPQGTFSADETQEIENLIETRQHVLRLAAKPCGDMLFAERPKAHGRRIAAVWEGAQARSPDKQTEDEPPKRTRKRTDAKRAADPNARAD